MAIFQIHTLAHVKNYALIVAMLLLSWLFSMSSVQFLHSSFLEHNEYLKLLPVFFDIIVVFGLGFAAYELAKPTVIPSFVLALFFGIVSQNVLSFITANNEALAILTTVGAALVLFGGGIDTPFPQFKKLMGPIFSLAFIGLFLAAIAFSFLLNICANAMGIEIPLAINVLLGAALVSTDPAAIIPCFKSLLFKHPRVKHITISESALTDVTGALLVAIFLGLIHHGGHFESLLSIYALLARWDTVLAIVKLCAVGILGGLLGYAILHFWSKWKERGTSEGEADAALFFAVPMLAFTLASSFGGSGFLAVFIAGLLFQLRDHVKHVEHFFNHTIEGFMKPLIFMLLGTLVNLQDLWNMAGIGIIMALLFMFVVRPLTVFISLLPFTRWQHKLTIRELLFISFVRETGVIPAVLLVSIRLAGIEGSDTALAIGMWVILLTLILQPPLTPWVAKKLGVAESMPPFPKQKRKGPVAVLCSRGYTFLERIEGVVDWCLKHSVENVTLLHCPEDKYSEKFLKEVGEVAKVRFGSINNRLTEEGRQELNFRFLGRPGALEENIEALLYEDEVVIIFVGAKMLDYRITEIKRLQVPFVFMA